MSISKLADHFENKYLKSEAQAQVGPDNAGKLKYAMNSLFRIVAFLQNPAYKDLLKSIEPQVYNTISAYKTVDNLMKKWYNASTQSYDIPNDWMGGKNILQGAVPDVNKVVIQLKTLINDANIQRNLQFYLDSYTENVRLINANAEPNADPSVEVTDNDFINKRQKAPK